MNYRKWVKAELSSRWCKAHETERYASYAVLACVSTIMNPLYSMTFQSDYPQGKFSDYIKKLTVANIAWKAYADWEVTP